MARQQQHTNVEALRDHPNLYQGRQHLNFKLGKKPTSPRKECNCNDNEKTAVSKWSAMYQGTWIGSSSKWEFVCNHTDMVSCKLHLNAILWEDERSCHYPCVVAARKRIMQSGNVMIYYSTCQQTCKSASMKITRLQYMRSVTEKKCTPTYGNTWYVGTMLQ